jgi:hypothetical protein
VIGDRGLVIGNRSQVTDHWSQQPSVEEEHRMRAKTAAGMSLILGTMLAAAAAGEYGENEPNRAHKLGELAAGMKPGEWEELATEGYSQELLRDTGRKGPAGHHIFQYTNKICWYRKTQELYFIGAGHMCKGKFIAYSAGKNAWRTLKLPEPFESRKLVAYGGISHSYETAVLDSDEGVLLREISDKGQPADVEFKRWDIASGKWIEPIAATASKNWQAATEYFPEMKTYVRYELKGARRLLRWDRTAKKWVAMESGPAAEAPREQHPVIEYNPVHKLMLFGGGNGHNELFALGADGKVRSIAPAPVQTVNSTHADVLTVDPVGGEFLLYARDKDRAGERKLYAYNVGKDEWRTVAGDDALPFGLKPGEKGTAVATPVADHGVVLFCTYRPAKVWLYKHSATGGR